MYIINEDCDKIITGVAHNVTKLIANRALEPLSLTSATIGPTAAETLRFLNQRVSSEQSARNYYRNSARVNYKRMLERLTYRFYCRIQRQATPLSCPQAVEYLNLHPFIARNDPYIRALFYAYVIGTILIGMMVFENVCNTSLFRSNTRLLQGLVYAQGNLLHLIWSMHGGGRPRSSPPEHIANTYAQVIGIIASTKYSGQYRDTAALGTIVHATLDMFHFATPFADNLGEGKADAVCSLIGSVQHRAPNILENY